ncbi:class I SAM-dependent methyltransferase [Peijinzhouia sedimentorum]
MGNLEDVYNEKYKQGYRTALTGYEYARWEALRDFIKINIKSTPLAVLDYGAGSGLHVKLWKQLFPTSKLFFADISEVAINQLISTFPEVKGQTCIIKQNITDFTNNSFDVIVSIEVMEHVDDLDGYLSEIKRILKPGGKFIWTTPCANRLSVEHIYSYSKGQIDKTDEGYRRWHWEEPTHLRRLRSIEIKSLLQKKGFSKVKFRFRAHFFSFVCTKLVEKRILPRKISNRLMKLDYRLFRRLPNAASMIGCATK